MPLSRSIATAPFHASESVSKLRLPCCNSVLALAALVAVASTSCSGNARQSASKTDATETSDGSSDAADDSASGGTAVDDSASGGSAVDDGASGGSAVDDGAMGTSLTNGDQDNSALATDFEAGGSDETQNSANSQPGDSDLSDAELADDSANNSDSAGDMMSDSTPIEDSDDAADDDAADDDAADDDAADDDAADDDAADDDAADDDGSLVPDLDLCAAVADWDAEWVQFEDEVLLIVNEERAKGADCGGQGTFDETEAMTLDPILRCAARLHSLDMYEREFFDHTNPDDDGPGQRLDALNFEGGGWGENIAAGQPSPQEVMAGWMDSDGHCSNIMSPDLSLIGVGYHPGEGSRRGGGGSHLWTQNFGAPPFDRGGRF